MNVPEKVYEMTFFLTAGETDARGEMPVSLLAERIIEIATNHANRLGIGYAALSPRGIGWVLSRLGMEIHEVPKINQTYKLKTWIESWNRLFSERCFALCDETGRTIGWGRSIWATIDFETRRVADITGIANDEMIAREVECGMSRIRNHKPLQTVTDSRELTFRYSDLDFNRHVNTVKYISHILNMWSLEHYDRFRVSRFEIAFHHECFADEKVEILADKTSDETGFVEIVRNGERMVTSHVHFI